MTTAARFTRRGLSRLALAAALGPMLPLRGLAQAAVRPMKQDGRATVYQRVLTKPGATMLQEPGGQTRRDCAAFEPLYVYEARPGWFAVGPSIASGVEGWLPAEECVAWKQNIVAAFTNQAGRKRQLLFDTEARLEALMNSEGLAAEQDRLLADVAGGTVPPEAGIVAAEPATFVNIVDDLYLMPILDFSQVPHPLTYEPNLLMEVASVPLREAGSGTGASSEEFDAGIVFVFDTTRSMRPFIEGTQKAVEKVIRDMQGSDIGGKIQFGVVGFRDNTDAAPGLEYRTRTLLPLKRRQDQSEVVATIRAATNVAQVDSPGFNEDSFAGVEDAVYLTDWTGGTRDPFDVKVVILITDAGPKDLRDPNARSEIGAAELQAAAQDKGVAVMTLHLKTPAGGEAQHAYAEGQYRSLSRFHDGSYYYGIEGGSTQAFEDTATRLVTGLTDLIRVARDERPVLSGSEAAPELADLGRAMQLAYLGRREGERAPDVIRGWVSEKAIEDPVKLAIEPRLLISKNEMATMTDLLTQLSQLGEQSRGEEDAASFFSQVRDVVARMAQNPDRLINPESETLGGALEFLEDLPYESVIMNMTQERWEQSAMTRRTVLDGLRQKIAQYRKWLLDPTVWTALYDGAPDGDYVFAMPFDVLP
ncbi:vWA domain-containing protein [Albibacillus kandeliae]|uniref:vWA domain-containing protein n=1 Tax=Albibacillus kandeliae TaxID=2174228 RepID=UPI001E489DC1|nr:vWA domain-containing protein [Albibacillus kandeliae]